MSQSSAIYAVIPIAIVFIILKICLIVWRLYVRQQRRDAMHRTLLASRVTVQRPEYLTGQMLLAGMPPSSLVYRDDALMPLAVYPGRCGLDPSLPPSYEQAITGEDHATTVEGEFVSPEQPLLLHYMLPPTSSHWADNGPHPLPLYTPPTAPAGTLDVPSVPSLTR
ncbi:hypothetical protein EMCRGX_G020772 [Ephydatia muelleri]